MANYADPNNLSVTQPSKIQPGAVLVLIAGIVAICFCVGTYLYTTAVKGSTETVSAAINESNQKLADLTPVSDSLTQYNAMSMSLTNLFTTQKHWESVLHVIEGRLYKNMKVTSLQLNDKGEVTLTGITPNYTEYANVYSSLISEHAKEDITNVQVISVSQPNEQAEGAVTFSFKASLTNKALAATL